MSQDRIAAAMSRIEQALARIETQAALSRSGATGKSAQGDPALRQRVAASLAELDTLIAELER